MVSATCRKADQPPEARPVAVTTPRWSAAGRSVLAIKDATHRKVRNHKGASRRSIPSAFARGAEGKGRPPRAFKNRGDGACSGIPVPVALFGLRRYKPARTRPPAPLEACRGFRAARKRRLFLLI